MCLNVHHPALLQSDKVFWVLMAWHGLITGLWFLRKREHNVVFVKTKHDQSNIWIVLISKRVMQCLFHNWVYYALTAKWIYTDHLVTIQNPTGKTWLLAGCYFETFPPLNHCKAQSHTSSQPNHRQISLMVQTHMAQFQVLETSGIFVCTSTGQNSLYGDDGCLL